MGLPQEVPAAESADRVSVAVTLGTLSWPVEAFCFVILCSLISSR